MQSTGKIASLLTVGFLALSAAATWAAPAASFSDLPRVQDWLLVYDQENGDHRVVLKLEQTRFFLTERTELRGLVELDLIEGDVAIELENLDREVDVFALDNAGGSSVLPGDKGDRLIHLARLAPGEGDVVRFAGELGPETFRGFELDWIYVSQAGLQPNESRLLYSSRTYLERLYTKQRLEREGFDVSVRGLETEPMRRFRTKTTRGFGTKSGFGIATRPHEVLVKKGLVTKKQFLGADVFFRETFEGNGRSCGTCHPAENNQTIDGPDFIDSLPPDDPLFVAENRPPFDPISQLEVPALMRGHGLILENVDGAEDPTVKFVMRGVPHSLSLATSTKPDDGVRTGWGGDGAPAPGILRMFLMGATIQHYPNHTLERIPDFDFRLPNDDELDLNLEFMLSVGRTADIDLPGVTLNNPDAEMGRTAFLGSNCNGCHLNASANVSNDPPINSNFPTNVELVFNPASVTDPAPLNAPEYPFDAGFGTTPTDCDPSDPETDGFGDCSFNTTPLIEAADTGPFFHNNTAQTIEDAVAFYSGPPFPFAPIFPDDPVTQRKVGAFLRVINAAFNLQMSMQRNKAALELNPIVDTTSTTEVSSIGATVNKLLDLSNDEGEDAYRVLTDGPLGNLDPAAVELIKAAVTLNDEAIGMTGLRLRQLKIRQALEYFKEANASLGTGTGFKLGAGNLLF